MLGGHRKTVVVHKEAQQESEEQPGNLSPEDQEQKFQSLLRLIISAIKEIAESLADYADFILHVDKIENIGPALPALKVMRSIKESLEVIPIDEDQYESIITQNTDDKLELMKTTTLFAFKIIKLKLHRLLLYIQKVTSFEQLLFLAQLVRSFKKIVDELPELQNDIIPETTPNVPKKNIKRDNIAKEILSTEQSYVTSLMVLREAYITPIKNSVGTKDEILNVEQANILFSNIDDIFKVNKELLKSLRQRMTDWDVAKTKIGDIFVNFIPFLKMYMQYMVSFENASNKLIDWSTKISRFQTFLQKVQEEQKKLDLRSYLIMPIQRIPRYNLLLEDLLKNTESNHLDYLDLKKAVESMKKIADELNENIRATENRLTMIKIQKNFVNDINFIEPHRNFVKFGQLLKVCRKSKKPTMFFLFTDILVYARIIAKNRYLLRRTLQLSQTRFEDINSREEKTAFKIHNKEKSFVVCSETYEEKMSWILALEDTLTRYQVKNSRLTTSLNISMENLEDSSEAPVWVPDRSVQQCLICSDAFTIIKRRHHCRSCGLLVCGNCSSNKLVLPNLGKTPVRVCTTCFENKKASSLI